MVWIFDANAYFVNSAAADDTGDGLTEATAKKTLAAAIGLSPPSGSTIYLSGGTHTVAGGSVLTLPSGVNLIGGGHHVTFLTGDSQTTEPYLEVYGTNLIEGIDLTATGASSSQVLKTLTTGPSDLKLRNCRFSGVAELLVVNKPATSRTKLLCEDCLFDSAADYAVIVLGNVDTVFRRCECVGDYDAIYVAPAIAGDTTKVHAQDCTFTMGSTADCFSLISATTAAISAVAKGCTFITGTGYAVNSNGSSTGVPEFEDAGGNNITDDDVNLAGTATFTRTWLAPIVTGLLEEDLTNHDSEPLSLALYITALYNTMRYSLSDAAGTSTTIKLATGEAASDDSLVGSFVTIWSGIGAGQTRRITDYVQSTRIASVTPAWETGQIPESGSGYFITPSASTAACDSAAADAASIVNVLPSAGANIAGEGTTAKNLDQIAGGVVGGGGAPVHGRMDYVGFLDNRVLDVIQGEEQRLTVVLETDGTFPLPITTITATASDAQGNTQTIVDGDISRVIEDSQVYVMRFTITAAQTALLSPGLMNLEVTLDDAKSQILGAIEIIETLV